jgi:DNA sulfur modification protein DndB
VATYLPALRAHMGDLEYFVTILTLGEASRMVDYVEKVDGWTTETPPELKLQRKLNTQRVEREMVPYLLGSNDHFYSALTVEIRPVPMDGQDGEIDFSPKERFPGGAEFGLLTLDGTEVLYALDGQHRLKSIASALRQKPELAREHITLILVPFRDVVRSQTLFSDLNRYAKGPSKSISILFTHRENLARVAKGLAYSVPLLQDRVNMESTSLSANSRHFITLSTLYEMTKTLIGEEADGDDEKLVADLTEIWLALTKATPQWALIADGREHPAYLRQRFISVHGVAQQALALVTSGARHKLGQYWTEILPMLSAIDWRLINPDWHGVAIQGGRVNNTHTSVRLLAETIEGKIFEDDGAIRSPAPVAEREE